MAQRQDSYLSGGNLEFIEGLYARFLEDPSSVDPSWRTLFEQQKETGLPIFDVKPAPRKNGNGNGHGAVQRTLTMPSAAALEMPQGPAIPHPAAIEGMHLQARVDHVVYAFRLRGHMVAKLDPLGRPRPALDHISDFGMVSKRHFSDEELEQMVDSHGVFAQKRVKLRDLMARLRRTYASSIGVEFMTVVDSERRGWIREKMEFSENTPKLSAAERKRILQKLSEAEAFESFLHTKYINAKRFSLDGGESLVPMLDAFLELGGELGIKEAVFGMAHRGRLNVLANILRKSPDQIFSEFEGPADPRAYLNRGDVKYHMGFSSDHRTQAGHQIHLSLAFNPSHLEAVDPVVEGRVRAKQDRAGDYDRIHHVPVLIHGDAAFAGQGLIAETLNLSALQAYSTGGTVHIVINNQIGFTTNPSQSRSSLYCTAVAQMLDIPIFHVNGDDPEACIHVMRLATEYRQKFKTDVVIDFVCYRRYGHNEGDEASFTQPEMSALIRQQPPVRQTYAQFLIEQGVVTGEEVEGVKQACFNALSEAHALAKKSRTVKPPSFLEGLWKNHTGGLDKDTPRVETAVSRESAARILEQLTQLPDGFTPHEKVARALETRRKMAKGEVPLDWAAAEALALASILEEGHTLRLTGQDTERGTFSHRHAVLHDARTGKMHIPLRTFAKGSGHCFIFNSPLSEMGCLGYEFGYSLDYPDALVIWEAQFGDFVNNAQVIVDQFISAAEQKWRRLSGLTMLLPHGYEGQGPEHSSARLERFLGLCADDNMQVCNPTTPANYFHLLRRQVLRPWRKPLIVMSPKSLLRLPEATSALTEFSNAKFQRLIADRPEISPAQVERLVLCSGKVFYDLVQARDAKKDHSISIARVEQLYPFPREELATLLAQMPKLKEVVWAQEEPRNMGASSFVLPLLTELLGHDPKKPLVLVTIARAEAAAPATGFLEAHRLEQQAIVEQAMTRGNANGR